MGAPKAPTIVQQTTAPSADEKAAALAAQQQKTAALLKINQDVFARSQGLRGAASMYDMAGPTPWLAGAHVNQPATAAPPAAKPTQPAWNPWGKGNVNAGPISDFAHNPFPANPDPSRGPAGDRDPQSRTIGGAPINTGAVPGGPRANTQYAPREMTPAQIAADAALRVTGPQPGFVKSQADAQLAALGLPASTLIPQKTPAANLQASNLPQTNAARIAANLPIFNNPALKVADSAVKPAPTPPMTAPGQPFAPPREAVQAPSPTLGAAAKPAPAPQPSRPAPAPAPVVPRPTAAPPPAPAPAPTLGGIAKPVVQPKPTLAPVPTRSIFQQPPRQGAVLSGRH